MSKIRITMLGTGAPRPNLERNQSSQVMVIDDVPILIDCGEAATTQLLKAGIDPKDVKHLWFTHLHSDHTLGYGQFLIGGWGAGRRELTVYGPKGTKAFHESVLKMYEKDLEYRISLGRPVNGLMDVHIVEIERPGEVACHLPARVKADSMIHNVPTFAYRFDIGDKTVVFSGDTAPTPKLVELARGADVLIHDCSVAKPKNDTSPGFEKVFESLKKEHCTPAQCADTAREAGVKRLVMTHLLTGVDIAEVHREASEGFSGEVIVAEDLLVISVD